MTTEAPRRPSVNHTPPAASRREYLRRGLPSVYRDPRPSESRRPPLPAARPAEPFAMRFVSGLERVLDPIVAMLDLLPAHLDVAIAPPDFVALLGDWLGLELDAGLEDDPRRLLAAHRRLVDRANEITRQRGTPDGIAMLLELAFDGVALGVSDSGGATWSTDPTRPQPAGERTLTITHPPDLPPSRRAALRRVVDEVRPAGVRLELRERKEEPE